MPQYDSDETQKQGLLRYEVKHLEIKLQELSLCVDDYEKRIRDLEDFKLTTSTRHKDLVKWLTVISTLISAIVSLGEHVLVK